MALVGLLGGASAANSYATSGSIIEVSAHVGIAIPRHTQTPAQTPAARELSVSRSAARSLAAAFEQAKEQDARRWVLPVADYHLTGRFGDRSSLWSTFHTGLDFAAPTGTAIRAVAAGTVTDAGWAGAYGYRTIVTLTDGTEIWYCHQSRMGVTVGGHVLRGQVIGAVGSTGNSTGPHVHLEVRPGGGDPVDPQVALAEHGATA